MGPVRLLLPILTLGSAVLAKDQFQTLCESFADKVDIPNVKVNLVDYVAGGKTVSFPDNDPSCGQPSQAVSADVCRVAMAVTTSDASQITLEAWFPRDYSGRFVSVGNGGLSGYAFDPCVIYCRIVVLTD